MDIGRERRTIIIEPIEVPAEPDQAPVEPAPAEPIPEALPSR